MIGISMRTLGFIYAILAAVTWGLVYTIDQKVLTKISPFSLIFVSSLIVLAISLPVVLHDPRPLRILLNSGKANLALVVFSVVLTTLANFLIFSGIKILGASTASIFEIAYPFFVILFSFFLFKTGINAYFILGSILIFLGSYVIIRFV